MRRDGTGIVERRSSARDLRVESAHEAVDRREEVSKRLSAETTMATTPSISTQSGQKATRTILIVDDNHDMVSSVAEVLMAGGYSTIPAYSAREACDLLDESRNIDLVLADIRMPDVDGFDLLPVLRHRFHALFQQSL